MDWEEVRLGEIVTLRQGFALNSKSKHYIAEKGIALLKISDLFNNTETLFVNENIPKQFLVFEDEIIYTRTAQVGYAFMGKKGVIYNNCFKVIPNENKINKFFLFQLLNSKNFRIYAQTLATGTAQQDLNHGAFKSIKIKLPPLKIQKKIAFILSNYDKLIENNNQRIKLLESMAEEIYKEWFVRLRFPECEKVEIVDGVPDGWENKELNECAILTMGQSPKSDAYNQEKEGLPFHQGVTNYGFRFPSNETWSREGKRYAEEGDILFSVRAPVGRLNIASEKIIIGRGISSIRHKKNWNSFLFYALKHIFFEDNLIGSGSIFSSVTKKDMENIIIFESDDKLMFEFNNIVEPMDKEIKNLLSKNKNLKETRDLLLPKLIHGTLNIEELVM